MVARDVGNKNSPSSEGFCDFLSWTVWIYFFICILIIILWFQKIIIQGIFKKCAQYSTNWNNFSNLCIFCFVLLGFRWMSQSSVNYSKKELQHHSLCFKCFVLDCGVLMSIGTTASSLFSCWLLLKLLLYNR